MRLYVIRHGETDWNKDHLLAGRTDIPLNDRGRKLAECTSEGLKDVSFDLCISSPLRRAAETAKIVLNNSEIPVIFDDALIEISFGDYEGRKCQDDNRNVLLDEYNMFKDHPLEFKGMPHGESIRDVIKRAGKAFERITTKPEYQDKTILISTHGCYYRAFLNRIYMTVQSFKTTCQFLCVLPAVVYSVKQYVFKQNLAVCTFNIVFSRFYDL